jgi:hypothetical protein
MKAVIYHTNAKRAEKIGRGVYEQLIAGLRSNVNLFNMPLVHLTLMTYPGMGDENHWYDGNPENIVFNREKIFTEFLASASDDVYWFTEPDSRIVNMFSQSDADLVLLRREDKVPVTPSWRLARKTALPFFQEVLDCYPKTGLDWDGDSDAWTEVWRHMGEPGIGTIKYNGMTIEFRDYALYSRKGSHYTRQYKADSKLKLLEKK